MRVPGWLVARDRELDLTALAVSAPFHRIGGIRNSSMLRAGEMVLALGKLFDGRGYVTTGIVHSQSGGPLAETSSAVIGINSMIVGPPGYAITTDAVEEFLSRFHLSEAA